jgi:thiosulfate reductase cytochrome b subunit
MQERVTTIEDSQAPGAGVGGMLVKRHRLGTRVWHWTNALTVFVLLMSGLMIFNAHPRLYWGQYGANHDVAWLSIRGTETAGFLEIGSLQVETTGVLGYWRDDQGRIQRRAFPGWATIPSYYSLSGARRWHLAFAWILALGLIAYLAASLINRHLQKDLAPAREELRPRHIWNDIVAHARLRHPTGEAALRYNSLQKFAYLGVILLLLPLLVLTGLTMSPAMDTAWPWLLDLFGGRQSARSIHFIAAVLITLFILIHLVQVVLAGPFNHVRAMVTGRFRVPEARS